MKHKSLVLLSSLVLTFVGAGLSTLPTLDFDPALYPSSTRISGGHFDLTSLHKGIISQHGAYRTRDDSLAVWRWYARRFDLVPFEVESAMGNCLTVGKDDYRVLTRHIIGITLCSNTHGTMIFTNRTLFMLR